MIPGEEEKVLSGSTFISSKKLFVFVIFSVLIFALVALYGKIDDVLIALAAIPWYWVLPLMMILSFLNYIIRYFKWQYYLHRINVHLSHRDSFSIFLAGFTLTATPGKIGEIVKGYFVQTHDGTPVAKTMPVVVSERVTDLLALVILAVLGFTFGINAGDQILAVLLLGGIALAGAIVLGNRTFYQKILKRMTSFGPLKRFQDSCDLIESTMIQTLSPKPMLISTAVSVPGWFMECLELWILLGLFRDASLPSFSIESLSLLLAATFIHSAASIIGALTFSPGGVGTYEITSMALIVFLLSTSETLASAATILIRVFTLWFSIIVGFVALAFITRRTRRTSKPTDIIA
ncbi:MAG: flippase-like domain-containing protein [Candidatus Thorarchaeota archaeon]|nr:flippase-like domain-containing protein [Candidatus Thorarchaeota archaeon]